MQFEINLIVEFPSHHNTSLEFMDAKHALSEFVSIRDYLENDEEKYTIFNINALRKTNRIQRFFFFFPFFSFALNFNI